MQIPLYQIQNILKLYSKQLRLGSIQNPNSPFDNDIVHMHTTSEGKRQAITDKVISSILNRIITEKPSEKNPGEKINFSKNKNQFTYTVIDENNQRTNHTLPVEDSKFIVNRMIELTRQVSDN